MRLFYFKLFLYSKYFEVFEEDLFHTGPLNILFPPPTLRAMIAYKWPYFYAANLCHKSSLFAELSDRRRRKSFFVKTSRLKIYHGKVRY
jgi:hypothetical protein